MTGDQLIMELTQEQGPGRETQVQPPVAVWAHYFDLDFARLPTLRLYNRRRRHSNPERRPVVFHNHNWTIEIGAARPPRPTVLRLRRAGSRTYDYWVYRPGDSEFDHCRWLLANFPNPHWHRGRHWLII